MLYIKGSSVTDTEMMYQKSIQLVGKHLHYIFKIPTERSFIPHIMEELVVLKILGVPIKLNLSMSLNVLFLDNIGQVSAELLSVLFIILQKLRNNNIFLGEVLIIFRIYHTQIQPVKGNPFSFFIHIISWFCILYLETFVRDSRDPKFYRAQEVDFFRSKNWTQTLN